MAPAICAPVRNDRQFSDRELIESALSGDQRGFEDLVRRYKARLFASIRNDVGCPTMAEDIVQEAFVRAFLHLDSFRHQSNFYTWLYRIALNSRRSYIRNRQRTRQLDADGDLTVLERDDARDGPTDRLQRVEEQRQVNNALARLEDHHRTILILREFEGMDYQAIADVLSVNKGTVRSRLSRARARLRKELNGYHGTGTAVATG